MSVAGVVPSGRVLVRHVLLPGLAPALMLGLVFTPVGVFGCVGRGLLAVGVTLASTLAALVTTALGARARARRDTANSERWLLTTLILLLPIALLFR